MTRDLPKNFNPQEVESRWYAWWESQGIFPRRRALRTKPAFAIVMPPPNVTGSLAHRPHAQPHGARRRGSPQAHAGFQHAVAARHGSRRHRDSERRRAGAAQGRQDASRPRAREIRRARLGMEEGIRRHHPATRSAASARRATGRANDSRSTKDCRRPSAKSSSACTTKG